MGYLPTAHMGRSQLLGGNVSQLQRAARHWGQRLEITSGREGDPEDITEAQRSRGMREEKKSYVKQEAARLSPDPARCWNPILGKGEPGRKSSLLREGLLSQRTQGCLRVGIAPTAVSDSTRPGKGPSTGKLLALPLQAQSNQRGVAWITDPQIIRVPWACPHLYRIKCFVY